MNSITSKIFLDNRRTKKDGTQALKLRITINRKSVEMALGYAIPPAYWNEKTQQIKPKCPSIQNVTRLNNRLQKQRAEYMERLIALQDEGQLQRMSMAEIKQRLTGKQMETMVIAFANTIIAELTEAKKVGNAAVYKTMRNSVQTYCKNKDVPLKQITYKWLKKYEAWYLGRGNSVNGLGVNLRTLRALFNRAIKRKLVSKDFYPFAEYSIKKETTRKRAITIEDIEKIKAFEPQTIRQTRAKDYFLMSFYTMGTSFVDLAFLKVSDIRNGRIEYKRKKTGKLHSIKITAPLQAILDTYLHGKEADDFILNVIKSEEVQQQYTNIRDESHRYNRSLKEIGELCGIEQPLTSYVARHSFATIAKYKDVPISIISQALGHSDLKTTEIYLAAFSDDVMDKYNEMVVGE